MNPIPAGTLLMGAERRPIPINAFRIDLQEVTVSAYEQCVAAGVCTEPNRSAQCNWGTARKNHPINCVDWLQADEFCRWVGKRLPTDEEWEFAARGGDGRTYPWGEALPANLPCWNGQDNELGYANRHYTCEVGSHPQDRSPFGINDMAGNVAEWTSGLYDARNRSQRGANWLASFPLYLRVGCRFFHDLSFREETLGFRCAQ